MKSPLAKTIVKYTVTVGISIAMLAVYVFSRVEWSQLGTVGALKLYLVLCDGCTIPGVTFLMLGCLISLSNRGALDGIGYLTTYAVNRLIPGRAHLVERYSEYLERKRENRATGYGFLYVTGLIFLGLAGIFMVLFYSIY